MTNVFQILKQDHKALKAILKEMLDTTAHASQKRNDLLTKLKAELILHEQKEEKWLYPVLKEKPETKNLILEAYQEHRLADDLLAKIEAIDVKDESWQAAVKVLQESLLHHMDEEEEKKLFPKSENMLSNHELNEITAKVNAMTEGG